MGIAVTRAAELRAEAEELRARLHDEVSPMTRYRVQTLIDELEAEARALGNGDAGEPGPTSLGPLGALKRRVPQGGQPWRSSQAHASVEVLFVAVM